jgi:protein required for attachment to host cells
MTNNSITWLLISDSSKARLYSLHKARIFNDQNPKELELIAEFAHEKSRMKGTELSSDKLGEFNSGTFVENTSPKSHEAEQFAHELLMHLDAARKEGRFRDLIIVAPPTFMGLLNKHMPHEIQKLVSQKIEKDYTQFNINELVQNLMVHF